MPYYTFELVSDPSVTQDFFHHMNDAPSVGTVVKVEGTQWKRVFTKPRMSVDTKVDPFSAKDFLKATNKNALVGDMFDRSKEMSLKRAEKEGTDPIKAKFFKDYSRRRKGRIHPEQKREEGVKSLAKKGIKLDWGSDD